MIASRHAGVSGPPPRPPAHLLEKPARPMLRPRWSRNGTALSGSEAGNSKPRVGRVGAEPRSQDLLGTWSEATHALFSRVPRGDSLGPIGPNLPGPFDDAGPNGRDFAGAHADHPL